MLFDKDADQAIRDLEKEIRRVKRLRNTKLVERAGRVHTVYTPRPGNLKRTLRRGRERGMRP